ncbi:hypothetical protein N9909_00530 [bacterium]|jgi:uncharacterized protein YaaN involved in tellurite resistance|nr:hypothetical protein [bacterium]|tara:strand:- start:2986 stop:3222 length:237 start_codon:yes stop_codon:yes gene_type:complete
MEMDLLWNVGLTILIAPGTYAIANLFVRMNKVQQDVNDFRVEVAKEYVSKEDYQDSLEQVLRRFDKIESKIDRIIESG